MGSRGGRLGKELIVEFRFAIGVAKFLPKSGNEFVDFVIEDNYYCYLVPLTIPTTVVALYANWVSLKFFRHN